MGNPRFTPTMRHPCACIFIEAPVIKTDGAVHTFLNKNVELRSFDDNVSVFHGVYPYSGGLVVCRCVEVNYTQDNSERNTLSICMLKESCLTYKAPSLNIQAIQPSSIDCHALPLASCLFVFGENDVLYPLDKSCASSPVLRAALICRYISDQPQGCAIERIDGISQVIGC